MKRGEEKSGSEAVNADIAISSLQRRGLIISQIKSEKKNLFLAENFLFFNRISKNKDIVILSRPDGDDV